MAGAFALRAGRTTFNTALKDSDALAGIGGLAFKVLPIHSKIRVGLLAAARIISQIIDPQSTVDETDDAFIWTIHRCPICWTRKDADKPACNLFTDLLQALLT